MRWNIWSVAGEALNFGGRRMETIMRVAWLPVVLLLIVQMVSVFLTLSITLGTSVTFRQSVTYLAAQDAYAQFAAVAWQSHPRQMFLVTGGAMLVSLILIASFMAPLIRYAATGEKPASGLIRLPFGRDQIRFSLTALLGGFVSIGVLFAPLMAAIGAINRHFFGLIANTKLEDHVKFPFPDSLHSVYEVNVADIITTAGKWWVFGLPVSLLLLCGPLAGLLVGLMLRHFHPSKRHLAMAAEANPILRVVTVTGVTLAVVGILWGLIAGVIPRPPYSLGEGFALGTPLAQVLGVTNLFLGGFIGLLPMLDTPFRQFALFSVLLIVIIFYFNLRLFAWPGSAVIGKSLLLRNALTVSRGWNLSRIIAVFILIFVITFVMQGVINFALNQVLVPVILYMHGLLVTTTRLINSGVSADWILPIAQWTWNLARLLVNIFWMFFSYGVLAGLYGRLYAHVTATRSYLPM